MGIEGWFSSCFSPPYQRRVGGLAYTPPLFLSRNCIACSLENSCWQQPKRIIHPLKADHSNIVLSEKADLEDEDLVVRLFIGVEARAYPVRLLGLHEVVNHQGGDKMIAVTRVPLCYLAVVYNRFVEGQAFFYRASENFLLDNLVLIDHSTDTYWSQLLSQGIKEPGRGQFLK